MIIEANTVVVPDALAARIAGQDVVVAEDQLSEVLDPRDSALVAIVGPATRADVSRAVAVAEGARPPWRAAAPEVRAHALRSIADDLRADLDVLSRAITAETGKCIREARAEVDLAARYFDWFATVAVEHGDPVVRGNARVARIPVGVVAAITTWNFPLSIPARKLAAALAAGCPVVLKPSPLAPVTAVHLVQRCERHLPPGVVGLVLGGVEQAQALAGEGAVRAVSFTGSTAGGIDLATRLARSLTRSVLELGGRAPVVVLPDADVDQAADTIMVAKFRNNGASCIAANNVFVPERLTDDVMEALADRVGRLVPDDPLLETTKLGPQRTAALARGVEALVRDAEGRGCRVVRGPEPALPSSCFTSAALVHADRPTTSWDREVFGPLLQVRAYRDEPALVQEINEWERGLGGYVISPDHARATELASQLRIGIVGVGVGVGTGTPNSPELPFGGFDLAGWGREGSTAGMDAFTEQQTIAYER